MDKTSSIYGIMYAQEVLFFLILWVYFKLDKTLLEQKKSISETLKKCLADRQGTRLVKFHKRIA